MTRADEVAFTRRLCHAEPSPDLVLVAKGLHDVFFKPRLVARLHTLHAVRTVHSGARGARGRLRTH